MTEVNILDLFKSHYTIIFRIPNFDIWAKLKHVLLGIIPLDERDKLKKQIREVLLRNQEKLTDKKFVIDNQKKLPTVANWLIDYNKNLGTGEISNLAKTQYLINGNNLKNLDKDEKDKVKSLFNLYEKLNLSSQTLEGFEEDVPVDDEGMVGIIKQGQFEPYKEENTERQKLINKVIADFYKEEAEKYMRQTILISLQKGSFYPIWNSDFGISERLNRLWQSFVADKDLVQGTRQILASVNYVDALRIMDGIITEWKL